MDAGEQGQQSPVGLLQKGRGWLGVGRGHGRVCGRPTGCPGERSPGCPKDRTRDAKSAEAGPGSSILVLTFFLFALAHMLVLESSYHFA